MLFIFSHLFCFRWAFVDLTAGPFSWGPAVGGIGVKTEITLPSVDKLLENRPGNVEGGDVQALSLLFLSCSVLTILVVDVVATEEEVNEDLSNLVQDRFSIFEDVSGMFSFML